MQSVVANTSRSRRASVLLGALSNLNLGLVALGVLLCVAPGTALSVPFETAWRILLSIASMGEGSVNQSVDQLAYQVGYALLVASVLAYGVARQRGRVTETGVADVVALFAALLLLDPYLSLARDFTFQNRWWAFYALTAFFVVLLCADETRARRLVQFVLFCIGVQAFYAIAFYALGINQFQGARFGTRTGGTFGSPNPLYPLCLLAIPLALVLSRVPSSIEWCWTLRVVATLSIVAFLLTFTRGAWLAFAALLIYFACSRRSPFANRATWRVVAIVGVLTLCGGVLLVRTRGSMMGGYSDSSFWGRISIWKVAARAVADKPLLGSGLNTYAMQQRRFMTPRLEKFRPANIEAKSLFLNVAVESGLLGLGLLLWGGWRFFGLYRYRENESSAYREALRVGTFAALLAIGVAGCVDTPILNSDRLAPTFALAVLLAACCVGTRTRFDQAWSDALWNDTAWKASTTRELEMSVAPTNARDMSAFEDSARANIVLQAALGDLDALLRGNNIEYWVIGSCARLAYMSRPARKMSDLDVLVPDRDALGAVAAQMRSLGERYGLFVDASLSRVFRKSGDDYALSYGPLRYALPRQVMESRRVTWGSVEFSTLPPQTLLHTFGLVAEPLRAQDRRSAREFARFLKGRREFDAQLFEPFHAFWRAHWRYFPLKPVQYWWRQRIKAMPRGLRQFLLRRIYPLFLVRGVRNTLSFLETRVCLAPRHAPERQSPRHKRGFTLLEIVVVLVVLGVLAALLYPVMANARQKAYQASCASTLKQFGAAFAMYAQDFDGRLPNPGGRGMQAGNGHPAVTGGKNGAVWCSFGKGKGLFTYLERQTDTSNNHWSCPDSLPYAPSWDDTQYDVGQTYSMNDYLRAMHPGQSITAEGDVPDSFNPGFHTGIKLDEIAATAQTILLFEGVEHPRGGAKRNGSPYFGVYPSRYGHDDLPRNVPEEYHFGMSNFLFCDGHVKALQPTQTWTTATQVQVEKLNYGYAHARGGRVASGTLDMWNPQTSGVAYP